MPLSLSLCISLSLSLCVFVCVCVSLYGNMAVCGGSGRLSTEGYADWSPFSMTQPYFGFLLAEAGRVDVAKAKGRG